MAKKFRIVKVNDNGILYYVIKIKNGFFSKWETFVTDKWEFHEHCGWRLKPKKFFSETDAEKYLKNEILPHDVSEYVVKEYGKPTLNIRFIKKDKGIDQYINSLK